VGIRLRSNNKLIFVTKLAIHFVNQLTNIVQISFCGTISYYIGKYLLIKCVISRCEGRKSRKRSSDSLKNPFTQQKIPDSKVFGFKVLAFFTVFNFTRFVTNPVIFGTGFVLLCVKANTNPVPKSTGFVTKFGEVC